MKIASWFVYIYMDRKGQRRFLDQVRKTCQHIQPRVVVFQSNLGREAGAESDILYENTLQICTGGGGEEEKKQLVRQIETPVDTLMNFFIVRKGLGFGERTPLPVENTFVDTIPPLLWQYVIIILNTFSTVNLMPN